MNLIEKLKKKKRIFVLANSKTDFDFNKFHINEKDILIVFNKFENNKIIEIFSSVVWVHRHDEWGNMFFGEEYICGNKKISHIAMANYRIEKPKWADDIIFIDEMPNICSYPIGKRIFGIRKGKFIKSPSTGYVLLEIINNIKKEKNNILLYAIGFGKFPNGWYEHAWSFERRNIASFAITLFSENLKLDRTMYFRGLFPDFILNLVFDIYKKLKIRN